MKKIMFVDQRLGPGGAERVMCTVIRSLDTNKFDAHLVLVSEEGPLKYLIPDYVKTRVLGVSHTRNALFAFALAVWDIRPDIVYVTTTRTTMLVMLARFLCPGYKVVARYPSMPGKEIQGGSLHGWRLWLMKALYRYADAVIAQTLEMADALSQWFQIPSGRIHRIMNPVDGNHIQECLQGAVRPFKGDRINIVAAGTISPIKGFDVLLEAFALVLKQNGRFQLHILGNDFEENQSKLKQIAAKLEITEHVHFHGFQLNPYPYYTFCDLFVLSSRWEALPNVILECLYLGKPVVATRCASEIERLINEGQNGFIVDIENPEQMAQAILNFERLTGKIIEYSNNGIVHLIECVVAT